MQVDLETTVFLAQLSAMFQELFSHESQLPKNSVLRTRIRLHL